MDTELKKKLIERKFRSIEYMEHMRDYHQAAIDAMEESLKQFYAQPPQEDWHSWHRSDWPETWEDRALRNFKRTQGSISEGIGNATSGNYSTICSVSGSLHSIFRNLDNIGWKWWDYVDPALKEQFHVNLVKARDIASNVWRETGGYWKTPESILKEEVTGPIDEQDLLRFLQPGEEAS